MVAKREYDLNVKRLNSAMAAGLVLVVGITTLLTSVPLAPAQINGTPASVTSINFGGKPNSTPGVPASITSMGPNGLQTRNQFFNEPACCINPLFPVNPNPPLFKRNHHHHGQFFPAGGPVYVPYAVPYDATEPDAEAEREREEAARAQDEDHRGGPTIFDRRGSGQAVASYRDLYPERPSWSRPEAQTAPLVQPAEPPVADQPQTVLIFKDGSRVEVQNYAVVGNMLYDLTPGRHHKIALADLDLSATAKENEERGIDFQLPPKTETFKTETFKTETNK
jgi:hypothetical protein